jgi:hypothetical protein
MLVFLQLRPDVQRQDAQAVKGMKDHEKADYDLESPRFINNIHVRAEIATKLLHQERSDYVKPDEKKDANAGDPVEHPRQHGTSALIP